MYQQINLYQPIFRRQRQVFSAAALLKATAVFAAALLSIHAYALLQVWGLETEAAALAHRGEVQSDQLAVLDPAASAERRRAIEQEARELAARLEAEQALIALLEARPLGSTEGFSAALAGLARQQSPGLWLTRIAIDGASGRLELAGTSRDPDLVPAHLEKLGAEPGLQGQRFETLVIERAPDAPTVSFRVSSEALGERAATVAER